MYRNVSTGGNWSAVDLTRAVAKEFISFCIFFLSLALSLSLSLRTGQSSVWITVRMKTRANGGVVVKGVIVLSSLNVPCKKNQTYTLLVDNITL